VLGLVELVACTSSKPGQSVSNQLSVMCVMPSHHVWARAG